MLVSEVNLLHCCLTMLRVLLEPLQNLVLMLLPHPLGEASDTTAACGIGSQIFFRAFSGGSIVPVQPYVLTALVFAESIGIRQSGAFLN
ncbi:MAG: hypothetical protein EZS28_002493 [Streblomastix strix]|uniref:Uncharacterized protein n=1 Tax=Streblomastix strix TaxID=222440 RepID=A0A5J4X615_9EUKA|nr:MAG: hypothetical protein EZS28_002493 [Streblomastix strix]